MNNKDQNIVAFLVFLFALSALIFSVYKGIEKSERVECLKWQEQAQEFPDFYLLNWQKEQCEAHQIKIWTTK